MDIGIEASQNQQELVICIGSKECDHNWGLYEVSDNLNHSQNDNCHNRVKNEPLIDNNTI